MPITSQIRFHESLRFTGRQVNLINISWININNNHYYLFFFLWFSFLCFYFYFLTTGTGKKWRLKRLITLPFLNRVGKGIGGAKKMYLPLHASTSLKRYPRSPLWVSDSQKRIIIITEVSRRIVFSCHPTCKWSGSLFHGDSPR